MGLMPTAHPEIEGLDVVGRCIPANHVSGDCFQYFEQDGNGRCYRTRDGCGHSGGDV